MIRKKNSFDFLRLLFASLVIVTHSYPLSGIIECDFLCQITNSQISFSNISVKSFFVISGYLIFQSFERSDNVFDYLWKRILRLYPGLIVVLILTILLSPFVYQSKVPMLENETLKSYIPNNISLLYIQFSVEGIFEKNPYKSSINGSLWTITYEVIMYFFLTVFFAFRKKTVLIKSTLILFYIGLFIGETLFLDFFNTFNNLILGTQLLDLSLFFIAGSLLAAFKIEQMNNQMSILILALFAYVTSIYFNINAEVKYILLPIIVILTGLKSIPYLSDISHKIGDLSYGVYIYGFVIQQTLMHFFKLNCNLLIIYSLIISYFFAFLSWHLVEKQALKLKNISLFKSVNTISYKKPLYK